MRSITLVMKAACSSGVRYLASGRLSANERDCQCGIRIDRHRRVETADQQAGSSRASRRAPLPRPGARRAMWPARAIAAAAATSRNVFAISGRTICRAGTGQDRASRGRDQQRECQDDRVHVNRIEARNARRLARAATSKRGSMIASRNPAAPPMIEHHALGHELPDQAFDPAPGAVRTASSPWRSDTANEQKVRDVRTRSAARTPHRKQSQQRKLEASGNPVLHRHDDPRADFLVGNRVVAGDRKSCSCPLALSTLRRVSAGRPR